MANQRQTYQVGDLIYIVSTKGNGPPAIVPAIVSEENARKVRKPDGIHEIISYRVTVGPKGRQKLVTLDQINGDVYSSLDVIRDVLLQTLTEFVDNVIKETSNSANEWYGIRGDQEYMDSTPKGKLDPAELMNAVKNPNASSGLLDSSLQEENMKGTVDTRMSLQDNIRRMVTPEDEIAQELLINNNNNAGGQQLMDIVLPDGTRTKVRMKE